VPRVDRRPLLSIIVTSSFFTTRVDFPCSTALGLLPIAFESARSHAPSLCTLSRAQEREVDLLHLEAELATKVVHPLRLLLGEDERDGAAAAPLAGGATSGMHV